MIYAAIAAVALAFVAGYWLAWWERGKVVAALRAKVATLEDTILLLGALQKGKGKQ